MKILSSIMLSFVATTGLATLSSCDVYNKIFHKESTTTVKKDTVLPQDREAIAAKSSLKTYSPEEFAKGVIKGDWAIEEVYGQQAVGESVPFLKFSPSDKRVYGNNGCNTINAEYAYNPVDSVLTFSNTAVTMMLCHKEGITDLLINQALNNTRHYNLQESDEGYVLNFYDADGGKIMVLTHQNLDFLNGTWKVVAIDGEPVNIEKMKLVFDIDEHKVHGNTGCNVLNGQLETDLDAPNTFSFEGIGVTMMYCPEIEYQSAMLVALEDACRAKPIDKSRVQLLDSDGEVVMTLQRTSDK